MGNTQYMTTVTLFDEQAQMALRVGNTQYMTTVTEVSIPFKSGLHVINDRDDILFVGTVSIPFKSGLHVIILL